MTRSLVLGAGVVGRAALRDLVRRGHEVTVVENDPTAQAAAGSLGADVVDLDVSDDAPLRSLLAGHDAVVSAVPYHFGTAIARAAIDTNTHYVDFGGNPTVVAGQLELDGAARAADVVVVPDCGLAPGLANVLARYLIEDAPGPVASVQIRVGALPQEPIGPLGYQLGWSSAGLINEYAEPCEIIERGAYTTVEPLTRFEDVAWKRWGPLEAFSTAGGASTMPKDYAGRVEALEYKTLRYPGHGQIFAALRAIGLFDESGDPSPRQVLIRALESTLPSGAPDVVLARISVEAAGQRRTLELEDLHDGELSALARTTAFPATALVDLVASGAIDEPGVRPMVNAVDGPTIIDELTPAGIVITDRTTARES